MVRDPLAYRPLYVESPLSAIRNETGLMVQSLAFAKGSAAPHAAPGPDLRRPQARHSNCTMTENWLEGSRASIVADGRGVSRVATVRMSGPKVMSSSGNPAPPIPYNPRLLEWAVHSGSSRRVEAGGAPLFMRMGRGAPHILVAGRR